MIRHSIPCGFVHWGQKSHMQSWLGPHGHQQSRPCWSLTRHLGALLSGWPWSQVPLSIFSKNCYEIIRKSFSVENELDVVAPACNRVSRDARTWVQGQSRTHSKFQDSLSYTVRHCLKTNKQKRNNDNKNILAQKWYVLLYNLALFGITGSVSRVRDTNQESRCKEENHNSTTTLRNTKHFSWLVFT